MARPHPSPPLAPYAFLAFPLTILFVFTLLPTIAGLALSLFQWDGGSSPSFIGLRNFTSLARDTRFGPALRNTLVFVVGTVPLTVVGGFILAVGVHARWFRGKALARTLFFLPTVVSIVAIGFVWRWILSDQGGLIPAALRAMGVAHPPDLLQDGYWPLMSIIGVATWRGVGFCLVLYLAALSNVNESLYEAAQVDGASRLAVVRHVTWPQVAPMTVFLLITGVIGALQVFDIVYVMTARTDTDATNVLNLYVYNEFKQGRLGYAAAIGVVIFLLTLLVTGAQLRLVGRRGGAAEANA